MGRSDSKSGGTMSVMLTCNDTAAALRHYRDTLGFTVKETWPSEDAPLWASLSLNGQTLMIGGAFDGGDCGDASGPEIDFHRQSSEEFKASPGGAGAFIYLEVEDVDAFYQQITGSGAKAVVEPKDQFYGIRDFATRDLDGYRLIFFQPITMGSCQSCGMPLSNAQPGQTYCDYCTDDDGKLHPYERVLEGTISGYFMGMQKMERAEAEVAAKEHLSKMPAWQAQPTN
jgi:uncharacterized glyoxalase superfamily protein PhnB